jgi:transcriptional regulator with XRE-family HTH domain
MIGDEIRRARDRAGLSQERLAELAGVHRTYVSEVERNLKSPTVRVFLRLCNALDVSPSALIRKVEERESPNVH